QERRELSGRGPDAPGSGGVARRVASHADIDREPARATATEQRGGFSSNDHPAITNHYNVQPVFDVNASVQGTDLGSVSSKVNQIIEKYKGQVGKGSSIVVRGQVETMNQAFFQLGLGIGFAVLLVYFLMVVNFQSWLDPLIILMALPGALAGVFWALFFNQTTISVPALS